MKRTVSSLVAATLLCATPGFFGAQARTLDLAFMPPRIEARDVCVGTDDAPPDDLTVDGTDDELTDNQRRRFLTRDITRLQAQDARKNFAFVDALITRLAQVDPEFAGIEEINARIALHIDAGMMRELEQSNLVSRLSQREAEMTATQRLQLAHYYLNGVGTPIDEERGRQLILDAAYAGNANALLQIARFQLDGNPLVEWDAPIDLTVTMAFGGMLGRLNENVCGRALRIAQQYIDGDVVSQNRDVANAWFRFAADLGSAMGAWRIVEYHLNADAAAKNNAEMLHYLRLAVQRGLTINDSMMAQIKSAGDISEEELREILGYNYSEDTGRERRSLSKYLQLSVNIDGDTADENSDYLKYLREISTIPEAPGWIFTRQAKEVLTRTGRWKGEPEAIEMLEIAVSRKDPEGMQLLAKLLTRYRDDPMQVERVIGLLTESVERFGWEESMDDLDAFYRCKVNDAPRLAEANLWREAYKAAEHESFPISATDLLVLDRYKEPRHFAMIQSQALEGRSQSIADYAEIVQSDPASPESMLRLWAKLLNGSDQALEQFAELEFELATSPAERNLAVELFRRIYLNNGVTTALDLAIALTEHNIRDPQVADEVEGLLVKAANRGEGAAIRLLARLQERAGRPQQDVYNEYAQIIDERGDFLALMFAVPFLQPGQLDDYIDRAVSEMSCGTKDVDEIGDAYTIWDDAQLSHHWRNVGLFFEHGHVLSKLRISDPQMDLYRKGRAPSEVDVLNRMLADGKTSAHRDLFRLTSDPDLESYDPQAAAGHLLAMAQSSRTGDVEWVLSAYRTASEEVRAAVEAQFDTRAFFQKAIETGSLTAKYEYGLVLRDTARTPEDLANSARWLREAAENGHVAAAREYGYALAYGVGVPRNILEATNWLDLAARGGDDRAKSLASLIRIGAGQ